VNKQFWNGLKVARKAEEIKLEKPRKKRPLIPRKIPNENSAKLPQLMTKQEKKQTPWLWNEVRSSGTKTVQETDEERWQKWKKNSGQSHNRLWPVIDYGP